MRSLAVMLTALWTAMAVAVAGAYRPGGPLDIVVIVLCFTPVPIALVGVAWPPAARGPRDRTALVWLWIIALLLAIPVLYGVASSLLASEMRSLVPSIETAYAAGLALYAMALFGMLGFVHRRLGRLVFERQASVLAGGLALVAMSVIATLFGIVVLINERSIEADVPAASPFGPVDIAGEPPFCDDPLALGSNARISVTASSSLDEEPRGLARISGARRGRDESWGGGWAGPDGSGSTGYLRIGAQAWLNDGSADGPARGRSWVAVPPDPFAMAGSGLTLDGPPHAVVAVPRGSIVAEDLGLEVIEGATARHCRTFIDGPTALRTFLPLRWLLHGDDTLTTDDLRRWRGELDWWVFGDGELGRASVEVSGSRADTPWQATGVRAVLAAELDAVERDRAPLIAAPAAVDLRALSDLPGLRGDVPSPAPSATVTSHVSPPAALQSAAP